MSVTSLNDKFHLSFIDDDEKMHDFFSLSESEFLQSYSYLSEEEYNATKDIVDLLDKVATIRYTAVIVKQLHRA